jgi:hypothetical protein
MIAMIGPARPAMPSAVPAMTYETPRRRSDYERHNTSLKNFNYFLLHDGHLTH